MSRPGWNGTGVLCHPDSDTGGGSHDYEPPRNQDAQESLPPHAASRPVAWPCLADRHTLSSDVLAFKVRFSVLKEHPDGKTKVSGTFLGTGGLG